MIPGKFQKQPAESFYYGAQFSNVIDTDNESINISGSSVVAVDNGGDEDTSVYTAVSLAVVNDTILAVRVKAGVEAKSPYKLTYVVSTTLNNIYEKDVFMEIIEV